MNQQQAFAAAGAKIKAVREAKGLSQEALSLNAEMDQSTLSKVERLGPNLMTWGRLIKLSEALDCVIEVNFIPKK